MALRKSSPPPPRIPHPGFPKKSQVKPTTGHGKPQGFSSSMVAIVGLVSKGDPNLVSFLLVPLCKRNKGVPHTPHTHTHTISGTHMNQRNNPFGKSGVSVVLAVFQVAVLYDMGLFVLKWGWGEPPQFYGGCS